MNMISIILKYAAYTAFMLICVMYFTCSIRLATNGRIFPFGKKKSKISKVLSSSYWGYLSLFFLPWYIGAYARGETSPLPWEAFHDSYMRHGVLDGVYVVLIVVSVDLWLLCIPAQLFINKFDDEWDVLKKRMARAINLLAGILLMTTWNPIYKLLD